MPVVLKPGKKKKSYEIVNELNRGVFAFSYEARSTSGERIFLKQYKSPTKMVDWYNGFVSHQKEIKRRIESDAAAKDRCYRFIDFFEDVDFFQAFEFIDKSMALTECLAKRDRFSWDQWIVFAKVMMFGIRGLHGDKVKIIHTDLKPDNILLIPDATLGMKYKLRIIDLDWAIFSDKKAPWHGVQGYVGTQRYQSPEHLSGKVPLLASDIFTCGIMLGELLGCGHPFAEEAEYDQAAKLGRFSPIRLKQEIEGVDTGFLESVLNSCLSPEPTKRPTATQICDALLGKTFEWHAAPSKAAPKPVPPPILKPAKQVKSVEITLQGKHVTTVNTDAILGKRHFASLEHEDIRYVADSQFKLVKRDGVWLIEDCPPAPGKSKNETLVDGKKLVGTLPVSNGMRVEVGNSATGIAKFPLSLKLVN